MGKVFKISSPDYPKIFLGKTISDPQYRVYAYSKQLTSAAKPILDTENYEVEVLYDGDDYVEEFENIFNSYDRKQLVNPYKVGTCKNNAYARKYYHEVIKPTMGLDYKQLNTYHANKDAILRNTTIKNITKFGRRPTHRTIEKYGITEQEIHDALKLTHGM